MGPLPFHRTLYLMAVLQMLENQHSVYFLVVLQHLFVSTTEVAAASILNGEINAFGLTNISVEFSI